jgi:hypothetical protein
MFSAIMALVIISCGGKTIYYPEANKPLFNVGDSFVFKDEFSEKFDTMNVTAINTYFEDHDDDEIEELHIVYENASNEELYLLNIARPTGSVIDILNIGSSISSSDRAIDSLFIKGKRYTNAFKLFPRDDPSRTDELEYLIYDHNYGLLKYKYYDGPEFVLDTVISGE